MLSGVSIDALIDEVQRRRSPKEPLHVTAITVLADADLERAGPDQLALAHAGWSAVRAEGATDRFPSLSHPSLELVRSGIDMSDEVFLALPEDDQVHLVLMGFLSLVGERVLAEKPPRKPAKTRQPAKPPKPSKARKPAQPRKPAKPRPKAGPSA